MNKNIILTGCNSAIGQILTEELSKNSEYSVYAMYHIDDQRIHYLKSKCTNINFLQQDLGNKITDDVLPKNSIIIHCAAKSYNNDTCENVIFDFNIKSCEHLSEFAKNSQTEKIIYLSSMSVYGKIDAQSVSNQTEFKYPDAYGKSKLIGEHIFRDSHIPTVALRLPGVLAPAARRAWLPSLYHKLIRNEDVKIFNPDSLFNNLITANALSEFIHDLCITDWDGFHAFPLGCKNPIRIKEIVDLIYTNTQSNSKIEIAESHEKSFTIDSGYAVKNFNYSPLDTKHSILKYLKDLKNLQVN